MVQGDRWQGGVEKCWRGIYPAVGKYIIVHVAKEKLTFIMIHVYLSFVDDIVIGSPKHVDHQDQ